MNPPRCEHETLRCAHRTPGSETPRGPVERAQKGGPVTKCPECESDLELDGYELDVGENVNCPECSIELKVVSTDPTTVKLADAEA